MSDAAPEPVHLGSPQEWRAWPIEHHASATEALVDFA